MLFQTATNAPAQKMQAFFSSDPANPDTYTHFYADLQLMTYLMGPPDPERLMRVVTSGDVATKENYWQRFNIWRWRNDEYDRLYRAAETEVDPVKRAALFIRMNDLEHNPYEVDFWNLAFWYRDA